jgi:hypothetical protein
MGPWRKASLAGSCRHRQQRRDCASSAIAKFELLFHDAIRAADAGPRDPPRASQVSRNRAIVCLSAAWIGERITLAVSGARPDDRAGSAPQVLNDQQDEPTSAARSTTTERSAERRCGRGLRPRARLGAVLPVRHRLDPCGHRRGRGPSEAPSRRTDHGVRRLGYRARRHQLRHGPGFRGGRTLDADSPPEGCRAVPADQGLLSRRTGGAGMPPTPGMPASTLASGSSASWASVSVSVAEVMKRFAGRDHRRCSWCHGRPVTR